jgi:hypothetical protein
MHGYGAYEGVKVTQFRRRGLVGHLLFMGGFRIYMFGRSEKLKGRENNVNICPTRCDYIQFYYTSADSSTCFG